jgi:hypothetical protein
MHACGRVISVILLTFFAIPNAKAQPAEFLVVNAASYANAIAPDSLATIFGSNLAPATASATLDANGQLPTELASIRVEFNGVAAPLFYVAPGQINLVVPGGLTPGTAAVVIRSTVSGSTTSGAALVSNAAPGVFTSDASGRGPGAILNAVTYTASPFLVQTADNGADTRTRYAPHRYRHANPGRRVRTGGNRILLRVNSPAAPLFGHQVNPLASRMTEQARYCSLYGRRAANAVTFQMNYCRERYAWRRYAIAGDGNAGDSATLTVVSTGWYGRRVLRWRCAAVLPRR